MVFAGLTVMIALVGLAVAGIPFLTTMGVAAAVGVGIAVMIALTLLPALLGFAGEQAAAQAARRGASEAGRRTPTRRSPAAPKRTADSVCPRRLGRGWSPRCRC